MTDSLHSSRPQFRSDLSQTPLPEVLATVHRYRVPGVIECSRGEEKRSIFIDRGNIIFATSNSVADSLGDRLLREGRITKAQYDESVRRIGEGNKRQGSILVEMRAIEPKDLFIAVREQVQAIVWSVFEWSEGRVTFQPGPERRQEFIKLDIPTRQAILQGVRNVRDARPLVARVGTKTTVLQRTTDGEHSDLQLLPEEQALLEAVDGKKSLYELTNLPMQAPPQNARTLYALLVLRLIAPKPQKQLKVHLRVNAGDES